MSATFSFYVSVKTVHNFSYASSSNETGLITRLNRFILCSIMLTVLNSSIIKMVSLSVMNFTYSAVFQRLLSKYLRCYSIREWLRVTFPFYFCLKSHFKKISLCGEWINFFHKRPRSKTSIYLTVFLVIYVNSSSPFSIIDYFLISACSTKQLTRIGNNSISRVSKVSILLEQIAKRILIWIQICYFFWIFKKQSS